jgi:hypothetical protein
MTVGSSDVMPAPPAQPADLHCGITGGREKATFRSG